VVVVVANIKLIQSWTFHQDHRPSSLTACNNEAGVDRQRREWIKTSASVGAGLVLLSSNIVPTLTIARAIEEVPSNVKVGGTIQYCNEDVMSNKEHGSTSSPVQENLAFDVIRPLADRICSYNRHFAEPAGYFLTTNFKEILLSNKDQQLLPMTFYDSVTGKPLFVAPIGRTVTEFLRESEIHGWPSFRDVEVVWDNVRVLRNSGETVSTSGTHLGHNLPDGKGNRYCINLVSIAGQPTGTS
jgi:hypothetical protein